MGRTGETYGEDPFLTSELVKEAIRGYQGNENPFKKVAVSVKHLVGEVHLSEDVIMLAPNCLNGHSVRIFCLLQGSHRGRMYDYYART